MPDDETLIVPQVSVDGQLGLPGDLSVEKGSKANKWHRQDLSSRAVYPAQLENQTNPWSREYSLNKSGTSVEMCNRTGIIDQIFTLVATCNSFTHVTINKTRCFISWETKSHQMGSLHYLCHFCFTDVKRVDKRRTGLYLCNNFSCSGELRQPATSNLKIELVSRLEI